MAIVTSMAKCVMTYEAGISVMYSQISYTIFTLYVCDCITTQWHSSQHETSLQCYIQSELMTVYHWSTSNYSTHSYTLKYNEALLTQIYGYYSPTEGSNVCFMPLHNNPSLSFSYFFTHSPPRFRSPTSNYQLQNNTIILLAEALHFPQDGLLTYCICIPSYQWSISAFC